MVPFKSDFMLIAIMRCPKPLLGASDAHGGPTSLQVNERFASLVQATRSRPRHYKRPIDRMVNSSGGYRQAKHLSRFQQNLRPQNAPARGDLSPAPARQAPSKLVRPHLNDQQFMRPPPEIPKGRRKRLEGLFPIVAETCVCCAMRQPLSACSSRCSDSEECAAPLGCGCVRDDRRSR